MIHDVDESLRALVVRDALDGSRAEVSLEAPTTEWAAQRNTPTVDLYLYDIREDVQRRQTVYETVRNEQGRVVEYRPPTRRYELRYLVTAWTKRPEDEHRLLSSLLATFVDNELFPAELLTGSLAVHHLPVYLEVALPPREDRAISDVWSALGGELKPSLDLVVNAPMSMPKRLTVAKEITEQPRISVQGIEGDPGKIAARSPLVASSGAAMARAGGAAKGASNAAGSRRGRGGDGSLVEGPAPAQDETIVVGTEAAPGRTFRIRGTVRREPPSRS